MLSAESKNVPVKIIVNETLSCLEFIFSTGDCRNLSFEFLRVHSPSAEVIGHGKGQEILQFGKKNTKIVLVEPVGNYGIKPNFSDGHVTGIYSWTYLNWLLDNEDLLWDKYLKDLDKSGQSRV